MLFPPRLSLAQLPTPIHRLDHTSAELMKDVYIWRDDLTGFADSGNKVRKLEFLLADARAQGCNSIVTCGGPQSNHTRATAVMARQLGLAITILILRPENELQGASANGNLLLNQIFGAQTIWIDREEFKVRGSNYNFFLNNECEALKTAGKKPYAIPMGGSNVLGTYGYRYGMREMLTTWKELALGSSAPDSIFCAMGSGGTLLGLQLGLQDHSLDLTKLFGINVTGTAEVGSGYLKNLSLELTKAGHPLTHQNTHLLEGYLGEAYGLASDADLQYYAKLAQKEAILLDPTYTGKAFQGMVTEVKKNPVRFGETILFLHSGGAFANFAFAGQYARALKTGL